MKNMKFKLMAVTIAAAAFFSCNQSDELSYNAEQVKVTQEDNLIERNILNLSSVDASKLAKQFSINEYEGGSRATANVAIKDIQTVSSESGEPLLYVVNYADNKGFTVISATKNYTPVLAYSEEGYLNVNDESFTNNIFMDEYKTYIESVVNVESDSLRQRYAIDWSFYEKKPEAVNSRAYTDAQIQQELNNARTYYTNQGYEVHSLNAATSLIQGAGGQSGTERANGFINDICSRTPQQYDCMDVTLLLVKRTNAQYGQYLSTNWHQNTPYCVDAQNGLAGCATIAVTQLMKYFEWPVASEWTYQFNWSDIRTSWTGSVNSLSFSEKYFMNSVREKMNPTYNENSTSITISNMVSALRYYDYIVTEQNYSRTLAATYAKTNPFIMTGNSGNNGHAWVCDGYKINSVQYAAYMIDRDFHEYTFFPGMTDILSEYFHMNIGWGTGYNAWFYQDAVNFGTYNFNSNRKIFKVTKDN